jgi:hypothetical protein
MVWDSYSYLLGRTFVTNNKDNCMKRKEFRSMIKSIIKEVIEEMPRGITPEGTQEEGKDKWIQKAVNPAHKGYCTPMTKSTCTPHRKALAQRFKSGDLSEDQINQTIDEFLQVEMNAYPKDDPAGAEGGQSSGEKIKSRQAAWQKWGEKKKGLAAIHDEPEFQDKLHRLKQQHGDEPLPHKTTTNRSVK